jgi:hypothetical protein
MLTSVAAEGREQPDVYGFACRRGFPGDPAGQPCPGCKTPVESLTARLTSPADISRHVLVPQVSERVTGRCRSNGFGRSQRGLLCPQTPVRGIHDLDLLDVICFTAEPVLRRRAGQQTLPVNFIDGKVAFICEVDNTRKKNIIYSNYSYMKDEGDG